jgi:hypothetical protein
VSTKYGIVNHDQVIQWFMSIQANLPSYKHITLKEKYNSSEIAHECYEEHLYIQSGIDNCDKLNY